MHALNIMHKEPSQIQIHSKNLVFLTICYACFLDINTVAHHFGHYYHITWATNANVADERLPAEMVHYMKVYFTF